MNHGVRKLSFSILIPVLCLTPVLMLQSQMTNPKVDNFLKSLPTFANIDMTRAALQNLRFTEAENRELEAALRKPAYRSQIDRLIATAKVPLGPTPAPAKDVAALKQEQPRKIAGINQRLSAEAQSLQALSSKASVDLQKIMGTAPKITSISPTTIEPGQSLIIRGTDLLPQGSVVFTFGSSVFNGAVEYWANDFILVKLTDTVSGIPEIEGTVTVKKPNARLRADAAIRFVPIWHYATITSDRLTYSDNPYDSAVAFYLWLVKGQKEWCSQFNIPWRQDVPIWLLNGYTIFSLQYVNNSDGWLTSKNENTASYVGSVNLPLRTTGSLCHYILKEPRLRCGVTVKGPLGLYYYK